MGDIQSPWREEQKRSEMAHQSKTLSSLCICKRGYNCYLSFTLTQELMMQQDVPQYEVSLELSAHCW